ncbi:unnamed protein product [Boreogadus saida]
MTRDMKRCKEKNTDEEMEEGEHHREEVREGESDKQDEVLSSDSEGEPLQDISSRAGPHDISKSRCEGPAQPKRESFPKTLQGGARRSFRTDWYKIH